MNSQKGYKLIVIDIDYIIKNPIASIVREFLRANISIIKNPEFDIFETK